MDRKKQDKEEMKTIIAGSRTFNNYYKLQKNMFEFEFENDISVTKVLSGCAKGADTIGEEQANNNEIPIDYYPADWNKHGKKAGYIRNKEMLKYADALVAFWDGKSTGTKHMIDEAKKYNLKVAVKRY